MCVGFCAFFNITMICVFFVPLRPDHLYKDLSCRQTHLLCDSSALPISSSFCLIIFGDVSNIFELFSAFRGRQRHAFVFFRGRP